MKPVTKQDLRNRLVSLIVATSNCPDVRKDLKKFMIATFSDINDLLSITDYLDPEKQIRPLNIDELINLR